MRRGLIVAVIALAAGAAWVGLRDWRRGYESTRGATILRFTLRSALVHRDLHEILVLPAGGAPRVLARRTGERDRAINHGVCPHESTGGERPGAIHVARRLAGAQRHHHRNPPTTHYGA